jgi:hypothetical protein
LANSGAVRGLGGDRNRGKGSDHGGEIFFIAVRQIIHVEDLSIKSEKTDGVSSIGNQSLPVVRNGLGAARQWGSAPPLLESGLY